MKKSSNARIINVSSAAYVFAEINFENINLRNGAWNQTKAYANSKLANILFTRELAKRLGNDNNINVYSLHPGGIKTELNRNLKLRGLFNAISSVLFLNVEQGCRTTVYCAVDESLDNETGHYYAYVFVI